MGNDPQKSNTPPQRAPLKKYASLNPTSERECQAFYFSARHDFAPDASNGRKKTHGQEQVSHLEDGNQEVNCRGDVQCSEEEKDSS